MPPNEKLDINGIREVFLSSRFNEVSALFHANGVKQVDAPAGRKPPGRGITAPFGPRRQKFSKLNPKS